MAVLGGSVLEAADAGRRCSVVNGLPRGVALTQRTIARADAIVHVRALSERQGVDADSLLPFGPTSLVRFSVLEVVRGTAVPTILEVQGRLNGGDEFNRDSVPYTWPRESALSGQCFSYQYRANGEYVLLLAEEPGGGLTPYWEPLQPVNEQVRGTADPWLIWIRDEVRRGVRQGRIGARRRDQDEQPQRSLTSAGPGPSPARSPILPLHRTLRCARSGF